MDLNDRISRIIEHSKLTPSEFADEIEVQRSSISHITSGRNKPSLEFIMKIKNKFPTISWDWLINGSGEMFEKKEKKLIKSTESSENINTDVTHQKEIVEKQESNIQEEITFVNPFDDFDNLENPKEKPFIKSQPFEFTTSTNRKIKSNPPDSKIKKIIIFYENGKFEIFEP